MVNFLNEFNGSVSGVLAINDYRERTQLDFFALDDGLQFSFSFSRLYQPSLMATIWSSGKHLP